MQGELDWLPGLVMRLPIINKIRGFIGFKIIFGKDKDSLQTQGLKISTEDTIILTRFSVIQ
ncbi:MAG: hypothetical protein ABIK61_07130 [candidate division WOR-3 bacterium]